MAHPLGRVGFRTIEVDRSDGGFTFVVNGVPIFVRGANWFPPDPVSFRSDAGEVRRRMELVREANLNMVRIPGTTVYADRSVLDACDELGILLWQDCMFAFMDYPDDEAFVAGVGAELRQAFADLSGHPSPRHRVRQPGGGRDRRHERRQPAPATTSDAVRLVHPRR